MKMNRKTFIRKTAGAVLIAVPALALAGCSSSDPVEETPSPNPNTGTQGNCLDNGTSISIGGNHGHTLLVSKADVEAAVEKSYSIQGSSGHDHTVLISATAFASLKINRSISITSSSDDNHTHSVTVSCA